MHWEQFFIDSHCHLNIFYRSNQLEKIVENALRAGVGACIIPGIWNEDFLENLSISHLENEQLHLKYAKKDEDFPAESKNHFCGFLAHGLHPILVHKYWLNPDGSKKEHQIQKDIQDFYQLIKNNRNLVWAIGETGFDVSPEVLKHPFCQNLTKQNLFDLQSIAYETCEKAALEFQLPLIIHTRHAWQFTMQKILESQRKGIPAVMIHCFGGPAEEMEHLSEQAIYCSFGGVPTWKKAHKVLHAFQKCDLKRVMLETDAPDLPPELENGEKPVTNEPAYLAAIGRILAAKKQVSCDTLKQVSNKNIIDFLLGRK